MARPTKYTKELGFAVCEGVVRKETIAQICKPDGMPSERSIFTWLDKHPEFAQMYARAREMQADILAHEIIHIADTPLIGERTKDGLDAKGNRVHEVVTEDMLGHRKLQIDTRKWVMSKFKPRKYGDAITMRGDDENPITTKNIGGADRSVLEHFITNYATRAALTPEQIEDGEDLV